MNSFNRAFGWFTGVLCVGCIATSFAYVGCSTIDPALPGTTKPAPFLAFTNGSAYLLGHVVTSNQVYTATLAGTTLGVQLLEKDSPGSSNYLGAAQAVVSSFASGGAFNPTNLQAALNEIPLQSSGDGPLINSLASTALSLAGVYVKPLATSDTNSAPYVEAALWGLANGL